MLEYQERVFSQQKNQVSFLVRPEAQLDPQADFAFFERYFDPDFIQQAATEIHLCGGRGQTMLFELPVALVDQLGPFAYAQPEAGVGLCYRRYLRGGLVAKVNKCSFYKGGAYARRARDEFVLLQQMRRLGLPVPEPVIARESIHGLWVQNAIVISQIPQTKNLAEILYERALTKEELQEIGLCLKRFFDAGVLHTDLNLRNILLNADHQCFVIDFDKCFLREHLSSQEKSAMLERLERSLVKEKNKQLKSFAYQETYIQELRFYTEASVR